MTRRKLPDHKIGDVVTGLTILSVTIKKTSKENIRKYTVKHESCGHTFTMSHQGIQRRIDKEFSQYCKKCAPRGPATGFTRRSRGIGDRDADNLLIANEFQFMSGFVTPKSKLFAGR